MAVYEYAFRGMGLMWKWSALDMAAIRQKSILKLLYFKENESGLWLVKLMNAFNFVVVFGLVLVSGLHQFERRESRHCG